MLDVRGNGVREATVDRITSHARGPLRLWIAAATGGVLFWRAAAYWRPSSFIDIPDRWHLPLTLLGLVFLGAGLWAWFARPHRWTNLFLIYGLCGGVHWGGAVGAADPTLAMSLFFAYLAATALGDAALLHLALIYSREGSLAQAGRVALYAPAAVALLFGLVAGLLPQTILQPAAGVLLLLANLFSLVAGMVFLARFFAADHAVRAAARLPLIASGMVAGSVTALLGAGGVLPGHPEAWNLALGLIPISLAVALVSQSVEVTP
jgi:hypothetical protein